MYGLSANWNFRTIRTNSWNAWSTFMRSLALHSMYGIPTEQLNCCASSNDTCMQTIYYQISIPYVYIMTMMIVSKLHVFDVPNPIYFPPKAWEIRRDPWREGFVSEIWLFRQSSRDRSTRRREENLHPIACTALSSHWIPLGQRCLKLFEFDGVVSKE